ncbi:MAG: hypothetical protein EXR50_08485 [Dehalococcoidia bacterium]|nr:hypothetical protein [Dehalococcoidia bacterium]
MIQRMQRAASLDVSLYEEVEHDSSATMQALQVVILISILEGIGAGIGTGRLGGLLVGTLASLGGWALWSFITYWIGTRMFAGTATYGELLRTIGFAYSPRALLVFSFVPFIGGLLVLVVSVWTLISGVVAVRQALDVSTNNAVITCVLGWLASLVVFVVFILLGGAVGMLM